jgi:hypothetical protein
MDALRGDSPALVKHPGKRWVAAAVTGTIALTACGSSSNPSSAHTGTNATLSASLVMFSACMRQHGVPNFPDPTIRSDGQGIAVSSGGAGINPRAPAFQHPQRVCARS